MGTNLSSARDFLELHERLEEDIRVSTVNMITQKSKDFCKFGGDIPSVNITG